MFTWFLSCDGIGGYTSFAPSETISGGKSELILFSRFQITNQEKFVINIIGKILPVFRSGWVGSKFHLETVAKDWRVSIVTGYLPAE